MTKLSIIILSFNTKDLIEKCLQSIALHYKKALGSGEIEILVVDNASQDGSVALLESLATKNKYLTIIENGQNLGFARGANRGAKHAQGRNLFFLNSDTVVKDAGLLKMVDFLEKHEDIAVLGGALKNQDGSRQPSVGKFYHLQETVAMLLGAERYGLLRQSPNKVTETDWVSGASFMIKKDVFLKLNGFDENFFMYMEDMEFCLRVTQLGKRIVFFPDVEIIHQNQGSSSRTFAIIQIYKGLLYFYKKHKPSWEYSLIRITLLVKALMGVIIGIITRNTYLLTTYRKAFAIAL